MHATTSQGKPAGGDWGEASLLNLLLSRRRKNDTMHKQARQPARSLRKQEAQAHPHRSLLLNTVTVLFRRVRLVAMRQHSEPVRLRNFCVFSLSRWATMQNGFGKEAEEMERTEVVLVRNRCDGRGCRSCGLCKCAARRGEQHEPPHLASTSADLMSSSQESSVRQFF